MRTPFSRRGSPTRSQLSAFFTTALLLSLAVTVGGCGGSGDTVTMLPAQSIELSNAGGVWNGLLANDLTGQSYEISGVITEDNLEGRLITDGAWMLVLRDIEGEGGELFASVSAFARPGSLFDDGSFETSGILVGSVIERSRIDGIWFLDSGDKGTLTLGYDDVYERGSDLGRLAGTWESSLGTVYAVTALGRIFGQTDQGCVYEGQIGLIDAAYNVYRIQINGGCLAIMASGLGVLTDRSIANDTFVTMLDLGNGWWFTEEWSRL